MSSHDFNNDFNNLMEELVQSQAIPAHFCPCDNFLNEFYKIDEEENDQEDKIIFNRLEDFLIYCNNSNLENLKNSLINNQKYMKIINQCKKEGGDYEIIVYIKQSILKVEQLPF